MPTLLRLVLILMLCSPGDGAAAAANSQEEKLLTVAEASDFQATATHAEVIDLIQRLASRSPLMRVAEMGQTVEGRSIPLVILADPPIENAQQARQASEETGKPICFVLCNIHAGEVCGKEASLMLAREIGLQAAHPLLNDLILVFAHNYNADGNDRMSPDNRPRQVGPARGMGMRPNAQGFDLNRDYMRLEAPESRALVKFLTEWDPHVTIDCHTTNGSHHRYVLTYDAPRNPSGHAAPIEFVRAELLPAVTNHMREHGWETWFYGNFNSDYTAWETYSAQPRYGSNYQGLRGQMSVLSEAYSYASYKDRVLATRQFVLEVLQFVAAHRQRVIAIQDQARKDAIDAGRTLQPHDVVGIRHRLAAFNELATVKGYEMERPAQGPERPTGVERDYTVIHRGRFEPTLSVRRPLGYLIPPGLDHIIEKLRQHGIEVEPFRGRATVEAYTITRIDRAEQAFQGHQTVQLEAVAKLVNRTFAEGHIVRTAQPLGTLAVYLLEPMSDDGLAAWNFLDEHFELNGEFPIARVRSSNDLPR